MSRKKISSDIVGISASTTACFPQAMEVAKAVKNVDEDVPVIIGGVHATFTYKQILQNYNYVDAVVLFEGEYTMLELVKALESGYDLNRVKGIAYRDKDMKIRVTPLRERIENLDELPMPTRHLLPMELYIKKNQFPGSMITSRGCPYNCIFCSTAAFHGHKVRQHSVSRVISEMEHIIYKYGIKTIIFADDLFTFNRNRVIEICEEILKRDLEIKWGCSTRVEYVDRDLLETMHKAHCGYIFFGIESGCQKILDMCRKRMSVEKAKNAIRLAKEIGFKVTASFILGLPGENKESIEQTLNFIFETDPDVVEINLLTPYPGTDIFERPEEFGIKITNQNWNYYLHTIPIVETENLSSSDLLWQKMEMVRKIYERKSGKKLKKIDLVQVKYEGSEQE